MNQYSDKNAMKAAVKNIAYHGGGTNTGPAIKFMTDNSFSTAAGHRAGVPKIAIVITDGNSANRANTLAEAQKARKRYADCGTVADIVFTLDSSGSVGKANFDKMLAFVKTMVKGFNVGQNKIRIGIQTFSNRAKVQFNLNKFADKQAVMTAIDHIPYVSGGTNTGTALKTMYSKMFTQANGDRPGIPNIGIVITDGRSNNPPNTANEAKNLHKQNVDVFAVGIGRGIDKNELNTIATDPDNTHVMTVDNFDKLQQITAGFQARTCQNIPPTAPAFIPTTQSPTLPPPCEDNPTIACSKFQASTCSSPDYKQWAHDNCRQYCGFCSPGAKGITGFYGTCSYNGKQYKQGETWNDGCAYECTCDDASRGSYSCYNKCPAYYNLPPQCTLTKTPGKCCLEPVCNFNPTFQTTTGQNVANVNGINKCVYAGKSYFQSQTWQVGCEYECICDDAGAGLWSCQSRCPTYSNLPSICHLEQQPGQCCKTPKCEYNQQFGTFTGNGMISGKGSVVTNPTDAPCVDKLPNCKQFGPDVCTNPDYASWSRDNCLKFCNKCGDQPGPTDVCIYKGVSYKQGQTWYDGCDLECKCERAIYGYYRCNKRCPDYVNLPLNCNLVKVATDCCKKVECTGGQGTFVGSALTPGLIGNQPQPTLQATPSPIPGQPTPKPGQIPQLIPSQVDGCYVNGTLYQQGQRWVVGCDMACRCDDAKSGSYRCDPKCPEFLGLPPSCTLIEDPNDRCCKIPDCPANVNGTKIIVPVPQYGPGFSGYGQAQYQPTGSVQPGQTSFTGTGTGNGPTVVAGTRNGCVYKGKIYQQGTQWDDGCDYKCTCVDATQGRYQCNDRCANFMNLPQQCRLIPDPNDRCCKKYSCDFSQKITTPAPFFVRTTPAAGGDFCVYKGSYYRQGEQWEDGCSLRCRCEDARNHYYQCTDRCGKFENIPLGCQYVPDPKDPTCCRVPQCSVTGTVGQGTSGFNPAGFSGSFTGYGKPPALSGSGSQISQTGYSNACIYKGRIHQQGETWHDGCDYDCECIDAKSGQYRCTDRCPRYGTLPPNCQLVPDVSDKCCQKADCAPTSSGSCSDKIATCNQFGQYACFKPYDGWARDNCAKYCGFCGATGRVTTPAPSTTCIDRIPNCKDYTNSVCTGQYVSWAEYNCPKFCNLCGGTGTGTGTGGTMTGTGTGGTGTGTGTGGTGTGTGGTMTGTGTSGGTITGTGTGTSGTCRDALPNCVQFTKSSCQEPYLSWAQKNCAKFCGFCGTGSGTMTGTGTGGGTMTGTGTNGGVITGTGTGGTGTGTGGSFVTAFPGQSFTGTGGGCYYKNQLHQSGEQWTDGCDYNCTCSDGSRGLYTCRALCGTYTNLPQGCTLQKAQGECCAKPVCSGTGTGSMTGTGGSGTFTGQGTGCLFQKTGKLYQQGQTFDDGCDYKCTCTDASRGYYTCKEKCVKWSLPSQCKMNPPAPGKCCQTPNCPSSVVLTYPPGYVEE
ncbi:COL6A [Mytilus coruscus]|uniref:COL6A n=1 Tax=Mytilus coruscus TaxID=42192 RepID=A0A6J8EEH0_MYTCO|nr:COL6A [Mytilus coruscus]